MNLYAINTNTNSRSPPAIGAIRYLIEYFETQTTFAGEPWQGLLSKVPLV